jgi:serine/threonine protein kinase
MQSIAVDTILQQRYRIIKSIGAGDFGHTYLATDQSRFGEQCAIKELWMSVRAHSRLSKAREFFQQEAALLYQLQHPQIPRFWATFEERDRMFLVQDFVSGNTYADLLAERLTYDQTFTEAEVWRFLLQILPVLGYLHSQGVVHQGVSPANIILRDSDQLPVLIEFGVIKQLANRLQSEQNSLATIHVGKPGYAPVEQVGSGYAYPNSDLYALAMTALVLLTGRPAPELLDEDRINWSWRNGVSISDGLANVLGKMLSYQPLDRYQSAVEVFQALQSLSIPTTTTNRLPPVAVSKIHGSLADEVRSDTGDTRTPTNVRKVYTALTEDDQRSVFERPQVLIPLFLGVATISFVASMSIVTLLGKNPITVAPVTSTSPSQQPLISSRPTNTVNSTKSLELVAGQTVLQRGQIASGQEVIYEFYGTQGQEIKLEIDNKNLLITVLNSSGLPVDDNASRVPVWQGNILTTGKHSVIIKPMSGAQGENFAYQLKGTLATVASSPKAGNDKPVTTTESSPTATESSKSTTNQGETTKSKRPVPIDIPNNTPVVIPETPKIIPKPSESVVKPFSPAPASESPTNNSDSNKSPTATTSPSPSSPSPVETLAPP